MLVYVVLRVFSFSNLINLNIILNQSRDIVTRIGGKVSIFPIWKWKVGLSRWKAVTDLRN